MKAMKSIWVATLAGALFLGAANLQAAEAKTYQVTGPVLELTPTIITVQKGDEKWQIARNKKAKGDADLKVGAKVTIYYQMVADEIEVKDAPKGKK